MLKVIKAIIIGIVVIFLVAAIGVVVFVKTYDFNRLRPQMIGAAEKALARPVDFKKLNAQVSVADGIQLAVTDLVVGEHPDFGKESFLKVKEIKFSVSLKDLILKRQIKVLGVTCIEPQLIIVRRKDGRINVQSFGSPETKEAGAEAAFGKASPAVSLPAIVVKYVTIAAGTITYIDQSFEPALSLVVDSITASAENVSLTESFPVSIRASLASGAPNIVVGGKVRIKLDSQSVEFRDFKGEADLVTVSMDRLREYIPQLQGVSLPEIKSGMLSVSLDLCEAGAAGLGALRGQGTLTKGVVRMKELAAPVTAIEGSFAFDEVTLTLVKAVASLGKGKVELSGSINDYLAAPSYSLKTALNGLDVSEAIDQSAYPVKVKGVVFGEGVMRGEGFDPTTALSRLTGKTSAEIKEGQLTDLNVLRTVLDKLSFAPNLAKTLEENLPERFKELLNKKDTAITSCSLGATLQDSRVLVQSMRIEAEAFSFEGSGIIGFDQRYSFDGVFLIPQDLAASITATVPQMEYLLDESKNIRFPLKVSGKGGAVSFAPDVKEIGTNVLRQKGREELGRVLDKALGGKEQTSQEAGADTGGAQSQTQNVTEKDSKQELIDSVVDTIFKK